VSLNRKKELSEIAKVICRQLRQNSTVSEIILWEALRNNKFSEMKFRRQHPLYYDITGKESFFIADFYCHDEKLIIELDGIIHKYKLKKDNERTEILNNLGLRVIRFSNDEIENNLKDVLRKIKEIITISKNHYNFNNLEI
jgi:very-short-patch-repair endonuclease